MFLALLFATFCLCQVPDRFFVIVLENTNFDRASLTQYLGRTLRSKGRLLNNYHATTHPSQPNYISMVAGDLLGVNSNNDYNLEGDTIAHLLERKGITWKTYQERLPEPCWKGSYADNNKYGRKHNPFISFTTIQNNPTMCNKIVNAHQLNADIASFSVPQYVFYTPDQDNDGHDTG